MQTSIATVSLSGTFEEKIAAIAAAGFDGIEVFENDFLTFPGTARDAGNMVRDAGLEITLFQPFRDFEGLPEPHRGHAFDRARRKFDLMAQMGADLVLICSSVHPEALGGIDRIAGDFRELGEIAGERGLRVGYEALAWGRHVSDHRDAWEAVRRADHPAVGLILDSFHTLARGIDVNSIRSIPGDKIFIVQLADAPKFTMDTLYWSRHFRNMPGQGELPVVDFMRAVQATGYAGALSLEIFNDQFRGASAAITARDGHRSLIHLMDQVRRAEPAAAVDLPDLPAQPKPGGVSFVEFAADEAGGTGLRAMLETLGFASIGTHVTKNVELWRQGGVNIVINRDPHGHARRVFETHGVAVCDVGLLTADAKATATRAEGLLAKPFSQPVGPDELTIPAIHGVGDSVLHFLDATLSDVWAVEFGVADDAARVDGAGIIGIDHIAQTMPYDEILSWTLFYKSIFPMAQTPMIDVIDPSGLVRSQAVESADGALRITLNGADSRRTLAGAFAERTGSAVQHVAFRTEDILATADTLADRGFEALPIPDNYFDDVQARFGLDDDLVGRLRARHILYDRDDAGEFFQLYSRSRPDGFFFEIVERRGGYAGYGAANAVFRVAAQKRQAAEAAAA